MILQTIERVATWLGNGTYGVNALLAGVPRIGSDTLPANVTILDERQHQSATRGQFKRDQTFPVLVVRVPDEFALDEMINYAVRDAPVIPVQISYATKNQDTAAGARDGFYTMHALEKCLHALWTNGVQADRTQGPISLVMPKGLRHISLYTPLGDTMETTGIIASYYVRDTSP